MLINHLLFWMMITEGIICLIISLPFGQSISQAVIQFLSSRFGGKDSIAASIATIVLSLVGLLFLTDVHTVYKYASSDTYLSDGLRTRLLAAQRDMYITGFSLFLFLLLRLVYHSMATNLRLEKSLNAMKKQAQGASTGYKTLMEENEGIKKQLEKLSGLVKDDDKEGKGINVLTKLLEENTTLTKDIESKKKTLETMEKQIQVVTKQAEGQSSAFMKLMDEKTLMEKEIEEKKELETKISKLMKEMNELTKERDSLKSQIQDYDFMFTDAKKKAE